MEKIYFITTNQFKINEAKSILNKEIIPINIEINEIQDIEVENVVKQKALDSYLKIKKNLIVEDTGLYFNSLNGFPGALIKWLIKSIGTSGSLENGTKNDNIIKLLNKFNDKTAYAKTSIGFAYEVDNSYENIVVVSGIIEGSISTETRGKFGFGWDDIFIPKGYNKSFAEMTAYEKNNISMRKEALFKLSDIINRLL